MKMEFSAGGVVYKKDQGITKFALISSFGSWTFPKGHIEKGEKPEEAAKREIEEEIGISSLENKGLISKIDYWFKMEDQLIHKFVYYYLMEAPSDAQITPQLSEISEANWFTSKEAKDLLTYKADVNIIFPKTLELLR